MFFMWLRVILGIGCALLSLAPSYGQKNSNDKTKEQDSTYQVYYIVKGDTIATDMISLDEVYLLERLEFDSKEARRRYLLLRRRTIKVYPYAKLAAERLTTMRERLEEIENSRHKRTYTKRVQKYIEEEFTVELKNFTRSEGQILVKLIHRQTGNTAYDLVKDLRTGWRAFRYNVTAGLFDISLKEEYQPFDVQEDYLIEDILERAFQDNTLERQRPAFPIDYLDLKDHWNKNPEGK